MIDAERFDVNEYLAAIVGLISHFRPEPAPTVS
jgi:hypothetical protein